MSDALTDNMYDCLAEEYYKVMRTACGHGLFDEALAVARICEKDVPYGNRKWLARGIKQVEV